MSSRDSPALTLDVAGRQADRLCVLALFGLLASAAALVGMRDPAVGLCLGTIGPVVIGYGLWRARWIGLQRLGRIVWLSDGRWQLAEMGGRVFEATLRGDSRAGSLYVWLRWDAEIVYSMLLFRGDLTEPALRRLIVRLRIDGSRSSREAPTPGASVDL